MFRLQPFSIAAWTYQSRSSGVFYQVQKTNIVPPWNLSNNLLDNCLLRPSL